jgi:cysteine-rich repeat protein
VCGDGVHNAAAGELCDDGNTNDSDFCRTDCTLPVCGDGWKQPGEACDDGNKIDGDGCTKQCGKQMIACQNGATLATVAANNRSPCATTPSSASRTTRSCARSTGTCAAPPSSTPATTTGTSQPNKLVLGAVHCRNDEGAGAFGFQHNLKTDHPDNCVYSSSRVECVGDFGCDDKNSFALCCAPLPFCGDGKLDPEEQCDDGNKSDSDDDCFSNCMTRYADGDGCG